MACCAGPESLLWSVASQRKVQVSRTYRIGVTVEAPPAARDSETLTPAAGRRASRHAAPVPRSSHLELLPGEARLEDLLAGSRGGLYAEAVSRGSLEANTGVFRLTVSGGHRISDQGLGERVGEFEISGSIASLLQGEVELGSDVVSCGAGWCAKDGHRLPVWARCPAIRLGQVEVVCA